MEDYHGSRAIKALVQACSRRRIDGDGARQFANALWDTVLADKDPDTLLNSSAGKACPGPEQAMMQSVHSLS